MTGKWIVDVKGNWKSGEIAVMRANNEHGAKSWGWFDVNKLLVFTNGNNWVSSERIWKRLKEVAQEVADELNALEDEDTGEINRILEKIGYNK